MPDNGVPPGTLVMLVLRVVQSGPLHGYAIAQRLRDVSKDVLHVGESSLYPALQRLLLDGYVRAEWGASENNRRARFYSLTKAGRRQLTIELSKWKRLSAGVGLVLQRT